MLYRLYRLSDTEISSQKALTHRPIPSAQHGSLLLSIPRESLTHISCYLDPRSLYDLSRVCRFLSRHVADDNTWRRAFAFQLLHISPENDLDGDKALLLRRTELSWKQEFIKHDQLRRRWAKSHNGAVTHTPHHANVSGMHLMPSHALLSTSLAYGIVARSHPLKGSVIRGFFEPSGTGPGGGNPNAEFTPNVSACALASEGNTARIAWGLGHGEVRVTVAGKAMEPTAKTSAKWLHCALTDEHQGSVSDICWDGTRIVSTGIDGVAKVWDSKDVKCVWSSSKPVMPNPLVKLTSALDKGVVVAIKQNGDIIIWTGVCGTNVTESVIPCPYKSDGPTAESLFLNCSAGQITVIVSYTDDTFVHIFRGDASSFAGTYTHITLGNESFGPIRSIQPYFSDAAGERCFILTGDSLGYVSIYDVERSTPVRRFEAFEDGDSVTALSRNGIVLVAGSAKGVVRIFDGYTLEPLRTFTFPPPRYRRGVERVKDPVSRILLSKDQEVMVVSSGENVMGWQAGPVAGNGRGMRGRALGSPSKKKAKNTNAKYREQIELNQSIRESKQAIEYEKKVTQQEYSRQRAQMQKLDDLGLNEAEAIEYLLMVSREEEEARLRSGQDLMFEDDIPNLQSPSVFDSPPVTPPRRLAPMSDDYDAFPSISPNSKPRPSPPNSVWSTPPKSREWTPSSAGSSVASYHSGHSFEDEDEALRLAIQLSLQEV